ncbi:class I SAM-dependent methyltransferase [Paracraurococcus ruber]|uniref:class I SAM-dependent methyltransferase n=1 Tax=Paracraurococcus ruber TaxID=77675 RepID=UPI001864E17A|nr:class I SAM-dependent methyltransferase [Paracraurococcus ruber]
MTPDTPHSLRDAAGRRWPAPDGIPFLRAGRDALAGEALARLDAGDREGALVLLLADQDDWWRGPTATPDALRALVRGQARLSLREAMALLAWGPVADYFAHRWSDPTFLAGLALVEAHWTAPRSAFELACGIGHHLRELARRDVAVTGSDVVFAKLWVARHWVCPEATLLCLDAAQDWPALGPFDLVACHDAFYFLEPKRKILARLRGLGGLLAISHVHNRDWPNFSAGSALTATEMAALLPDAVLYDDADLTRALADGDAPRPATPAALRSAEAFAAVAGPGLAPAHPVAGLLALPPPGTLLRRNPLYDAEGRIAWPSERYGREYGARATYPPCAAAPDRAVLDAATEVAARRRELLDLPERW